MEESMSCYRVAVHYKDIANIPPITNKWFGVTVSKIHGKRNMYTDIQEYIQTHGSPGIIIPDARVITHDVAMQLAHFMIRTPSLGMVIQYDNPDNEQWLLHFEGHHLWADEKCSGKELCHIYQQWED